MSEPLVKQGADRNGVYRDPFEIVNAYLAKFGEEVGTRFDDLDDDGYTDVRHAQVRVGINVVRNPEVLLLLVRMGECPAAGDVAAHLYQHLLELNFLATQDCAFAIDEKQRTIYLRTMRNLRGMDYDEFRRLLQGTVAIAEDLSARLEPPAP